MSTMYDALRKAEAKQKKTTGFVEETGFGSGDSLSRGSGTADNVKATVLLIAVIAVFGIAFYRFHAAQKKQTMAAKPAATMAVAPVQTLAPLASKPQRAPGTYGLDGVINAGADSMAIVNGKLLKPEQAIDHLILKTISPKQVELLNTKDNSTVILKIN